MGAQLSNALDLIFFCITRTRVVPWINRVPCSSRRRVSKHERGL